MVLDEGKENGIGIWEITGYSKIESRIRNIIKEYLKSQDIIHPEEIDVEDILVVGSFGSGMGVKEKSDLDIVVLVWYSGDNRSNDFSMVMKRIAGVINSNQDSILSGFESFTGLEAYVFPYLERFRHLSEMATHGPVDSYYNLTTDERVNFESM